MDTLASAGFRSSPRIITSSPIRALLVEISKIRGCPNTTGAQQKNAKAKARFLEVMDSFYHRRSFRKLGIVLHRCALKRPSNHIAHVAIRASPTLCPDPRLRDPFPKSVKKLPFSSDKQAMDSPRAKVLVIEDHDSVRIAITRFLQTGGFDVLDAATPEAALAIWSEHAHRISLL